MSIGTLQDIIVKIRRLTVSGNSNQITNSQIIDYINSFYLYDLPAYARILKLQDKYYFNTIKGIDTYAFDSEGYTTIQQPVYCMKREIKLFQDPWSFWGVNYNWQFQQNFATGDGTVGALTGVITAITNAANAQVTSAGHGLATGNTVVISGVLGMTQVNGIQFNITVDSVNTFLLNVDSTAYGIYAGGGTWTKEAYNGTAQSTPIIRSVNNDPLFVNPVTNTRPYPISKVQNILITANTALGATENVTDDGNGGLIDPDTGASRGTINYDTGAISVTFASAIPSGESIQIQYNPATMSIPLSILFFQNQFTLRPVPDRGYTIEMTAYRQPSQALLGTTDPDNPTFTGTPELLELWELLAFGAAKKFYEDRLDPDGVALMEKALVERYMVAENRTYAQLGKVRAPSIFADQLTNNYGSSGWGFGQGT